MIDLTKLNSLGVGGGVPQSKAIRPTMSIEEQLERMEQCDRYLKEQRDRIAKTSALKLDIYRAVKEETPSDQLIDLLLECVSLATNDKAFLEMCKKQ